MGKYLAKIIANDQEGLQMISACIAGSKTKVSDIKYLSTNKVFLISIELSLFKTPETIPLQPIFLNLSISRFINSNSSK